MFFFYSFQAHLQLLLSEICLDKKFVISYLYEDNIKMYLKDIGLEGGDWICLAEDRDEWWAVVNMGMNFAYHKMWGIH